MKRTKTPAKPYQPSWTSASGKITRVSDMATTHIENCIGWIEKQIASWGEHLIHCYKDNISYDEWMRIFNAELAVREQGVQKPGPTDSHVPASHSICVSSGSHTWYDAAEDTYNVTESRQYRRA